MTTIAVIVGSVRRESINRRLAEALTRLPAGQGHRFTFVEVGGLPLYNQDDDKDPPEAAVRLKREVRAADGVLFVTPEYNRSIPGVLKNALDHGSRPHGDSAWANKPAGIIGTSGGKAGTAMAQQHLRNVLAYLDMPTLAQPEAFVQWSDALVSAEGEIGPGSRAFLDGWMKAFIALVEHHWPPVSG